jgi:hypothetical protein
MIQQLTRCACCAASSQTGGLYPVHCPSCLHCGARLIQRLGTLSHIVGPGAVKRRRTQVLDDWVAYGHDRAALRALAQGSELPLAPLRGTLDGLGAPEPKAATGKRRG